MTMIDTTDSRFPKAVEIAAQAGQWAKCHTRDGRKCYAVPSSHDANVRYLVDGQECQCHDFKRHGQPCKHILAVQIHCALVKASQPKPRAKRQPVAAAAPASSGVVLQMVREPDGTLSWERPTRTLPPLTDEQARRVFSRL